MSNQALDDDINAAWMLGSKQEFYEFLKTNPYPFPPRRLDSFDSAVKLTYSLLLSKQEFDEGLKKFVLDRINCRLQTGFRPSERPGLEDTYRWRVVKPGEARVGSVEMEFLPDNPPERQYRFRVVDGISDD